MKRIPLLGSCLAVLLAVTLYFSPSDEANAVTKDSLAMLANVQQGDTDITRIGRMSFAPQGVLLVADIGSASVVAIDTQDTGPVKKLKERVNDVDKKIAAALGTDKAGINIADMTVNPASGKIYVSVQRKADGLNAIITFDENGKLAPLNLKKARYVRVPLPVADQKKIGNITGVEFTDGRVLAAGQSNEEFSSKIYSLPLPLTHNKPGEVYSTETYHVAHGRWETRAPIQSFIPYQEEGEDYIVGSFACTPIAKFKISDIKKNATIKGTSVVELGSGNRPVDMFTYKKNGKNWLITNTDRFHHERRPLGPSQYWGVRVDMSYLQADKTNEEAARRVVTEKSGPNGIEVVDALFFAKHVAKLNNDEMVILRDNEGALDLEVTKLPE